MLNYAANEQHFHRSNMAGEPPVFTIKRTPQPRQLRADRQTSRLGTQPDTLTDTSEAHDGDLSMFHGHTSPDGRLF